jgi:hypothetical protein
MRPVGFAWLVAVACCAGVARGAATAVFAPASRPAAPLDVDGDGHEDDLRIVTAPERPDEEPRCRRFPDATQRVQGGGGCSFNVRSTKLVAELSRLGRRKLKIASAIADTRVLGVVDINHDGYGEIFIEIDHGASTRFFTLFRLIGEQMVQITLDGRPVSMPLGGSVTHYDVLGCRTGELVHGSWGIDPINGSAAGSITAYRLEEVRLRVIRTTSYTWTCANDTRGLCPTGEQMAATGYDLECPVQ